MAKVALVTGASGGIGSATALELAREGFDVAVHYRGNPEQAEAIVKEIRSLGRLATAIYGDLTVPGDPADVVDQVIKELGTLDALINNAGITRDMLLMRMSDEDWDAVLDINLKAAFAFARAATRPMLRQRSGTIIFVSSVVGIGGNVGQANYAAAKAGMIGLAKSIAKEVGSRSITVNVVALGFIDTSMTRGLSAEQKQQILERTPLHRIGDPQDVANAISFLVSPKASFVTGTVLPVDGGLSLG